MKKLYILGATALLISTNSFSQSQRLELIEEFTGETCGPCASQNPGFDNLLNANSTKIVSIKYQNNIPSTGPNFYLYNTPDVSNRTSFYANNYSPHGFFEGNQWNSTVGSFTSTLINNRYTVPSSFDVLVSHSFSAAYDSIYTHTVVRCTQAVTGLTTLHLRVAVTEADIQGYTSPNGESHYKHVMRKMLPNGTGTVLPADWAVGDSVVTDLAWKIATPASGAIFMPYWAELEVVSFVQNDITKEVMQTGISRPDPTVLVNAAITAISPVINCNPNYTPIITLKNYDGNPVTSLDIEYYLDAAAPSTFTWNGTLNAGASAAVTLPSIPFSGVGAHVMHANIVSVNGSPVLVNVNNNKTITNGQPVAPVISFTEGFTPVLFPPTNWLLDNPDASYTWTRSSVGGFGLSSGSAKIDFYNSANGQIDYMYPLIPLDLTGATSASLTFNVAYARYATSGTGSNDRLEVRFSTDCALTWTSLYNKSGTTLYTNGGAAVTGAFTPTAAQWRAETIDLASLLGQGSVLVNFKATSNYGNNCYVDDINLTTSLGVNEIANANSINVYPNPASDKITITGSFDGSKNVAITFVDLMGKEVMSFESKSAAILKHSFDVSHLAKGIYMMNVTIDGTKTVRKITIE